LERSIYLPIKDIINNIQSWGKSWTVNDVKVSANARVVNSKHKLEIY
jgi:hypothetical protein